MTDQHQSLCDDEVWYSEHDAYARQDEMRTHRDKAEGRLANAYRLLKAVLNRNCKLTEHRYRG